MPINFLGGKSIYKKQKFQAGLDSTTLYVKQLDVYYDGCACFGAPKGSWIRDHSDCKTLPQVSGYLAWANFAQLLSNPTLHSFKLTSISWTFPSCELFICNAGTKT